MYHCSVELSIRYDGQSRNESEHASLIADHARLILWQTGPICILNTAFVPVFDCLRNTLVQLCSETLLSEPLVRYARFEHWICSSGSTADHTLSNKRCPMELSVLYTNIGNRERIHCIDS